MIINIFQFISYFYICKYINIKNSENSFKFEGEDLYIVGIEIMFNNFISFIKNIKQINIKEN
jgi:hypothetical protein